MLKKVLVGLAALVAVLLVVIAARPSTYHVERSLSMNVPAEAAFAQINDFHNWAAWEPWGKLDPNEKITYSGPDSGVGASYSWVGNDQVGEGRMTIEESRPNERVAMKLEFIKPFESSCQSSFDLKPQDGKTLVTWSMDGENNFMGKAFSLVKNMDEMIGKDFEAGLQGMQKAAEEAQARKAAEEAARAAEAAKAAELAKATEEAQAAGGAVVAGVDGGAPVAPANP